MIKTFEQFNNQDIDAISKEYNIKGYTIREDGKVDVNGSVYLDNKNLTKLPLDFGIVNGIFDCSGNKLTNLEGSPEKVLEHFWCNDNYLTSLEGALEYVGGDFDCYDNNLTSLYNVPKYIVRIIDVRYNKILDVKGLVSCKFGILNEGDNPIYSIIKDIDDLEHFYLINPLNGNKLSRSLYDEVREYFELPEFDYSTLHKDIELID